VKKWIGSTFWVVSTKYLQSYLNRFRAQQAFKNSLLPTEEVVKCSTADLFEPSTIPSSWRQISNVKINAIINYSQRIEELMELVLKQMVAFVQ